ncbi:thermonuclease family protein [Bacillus subtilis]|uniref:thermonuclease family protein n=1 Tax=Bacillus subtilis TaxID=1423 RepID=UPI002DB9CF18|nr:thermonuclease family protein [Bacillus subtilis]MEC0285543.1 thermonuclease family protein [Bacillus subtilis]MEC0481506.1 thermonuclease family protein [Bacillus subtilis]MEC0522224.1 thermonuclease family protein [Bacillus subtilis]
MLTRKLLQALAVLVILLSGCQGVSSSSHSDTTENTVDLSDKIEVTVSRVIDGDTFIADVNGTEERIRLILVDTPETVHPTKTVQPYGKEASAFSKKTLENQSVYLEYDKEKRDKYDRLLAYVFLKDGTSFNKILLEKGYARLAVFPPNIKYKDEYKQAEEAAKNEKIGIWNNY